MSTCKALLSKITNKNAFYEQEDVTQNIFAFRVVGIYFYRGSGDFYQRLCGGMCADADLWIAACEDGA